MRVNDDYAQGWHVEAEREDPNSVLNFWKRALEARKKNDVLVSLSLAFFIFTC